jgi:hypothetical protein
MGAKRELWYKNKLHGIFGNVKIWHKDGYSIFMSIKQSHTYAKIKKTKGNSRNSI